MSQISETNVKLNSSGRASIMDMKWGGIPSGLFFVMVALIAICIYLPVPITKGGETLIVQGGLIPKKGFVIFGILSIFAILFGEIGERIPVWNKYIGGGVVLVFLLSSFSATYGLIPEYIVKTTKEFYQGNFAFLSFFITILVVGSVLSTDRDVLLKGSARMVPLIFIGIFGATVAGSVVGIAFGLSPVDVFLNYILPVMGGGNGAGAIPMRSMYEGATGIPGSGQDWYTKAFVVLTMANILSIIAGSILRTIGEKHPHLTGHGNILKSPSNNDIIKSENKELITEDNSNPRLSIINTFFFCGFIFFIAYALQVLWNQFIAPNIGGISIHAFAWLVILAIVLNVLNCIPQDIRNSAKWMQESSAKYTIYFSMVAIGFTVSFMDIINALNIMNLSLALAIVLGAAIAIMLSAKRFGMQEIESSIAAGLCMSNMGGSGDIAVLSAADRMSLMPFSAISSRIGGAIMLIIGSIAFGLFL